MMRLCYADCSGIWNESKESQQKWTRDRRRRSGEQKRQMHPYPQDEVLILPGGEAAEGRGVERHEVGDGEARGAARVRGLLVAQRDAEAEQAEQKQTGRGRRRRRHWRPSVQSVSRAPPPLTPLSLSQLVVYGFSRIWQRRRDEIGWCWCVQTKGWDGQHGNRVGVGAVCRSENDGWCRLPLPVSGKRLSRWEARMSSYIPGVTNHGIELVEWFS
jgi:hypothetical protein